MKTGKKPGGRKWWEPNPETLLEDLAALAFKKNDRWWPGHGPTPLHVIEKANATRRAKKAARQEAAIKRFEARLDQVARRARHGPQPFGASMAERMVRAMEPGEWYGMGDIARAAGVGREARGKVVQRLIPLGLIEAAENVDANHGPQKANEPPAKLYRLTAAGEALRGAIMLVE